MIEHLPCDILLSPHPPASGLWQRPLIDPDACKRYADSGRAGLATRLASESAQ